MVVKSNEPLSGMPSALQKRGRADVLIIEARFYDDVLDELVSGAVAELEEHGVGYDRVTVPGALEIPQVLAQALGSNLIGSNAPAARFGGVVALGCVIRGETSHYDIVVNNANHWLMELAVQNQVPVGNGILTVDTKAQALARARGGRAGKGGDAVRACLTLMDLSYEFENQGA